MIHPIWINSHYNLSFEDGGRIGVLVLQCTCSTNVDVDNLLINWSIKLVVCICHTYDIARVKTYIGSAIANYDLISSFFFFFLCWGQIFKLTNITSVYINFRFLGYFYYFFIIHIQYKISWHVQVDVHNLVK